MKERIILHCDMNSFFASVELLSHPELKEKPVAVCGNPEERRGIILAKNELAKKTGVKTAETIWEAKKKCPDLVLLPPHHELYSDYSKKVNAIYLQYTDLVEPFSIDESWLDITNTIHLFHKSPEEIADEIRSRVREELGLTLSIGVSFNKIFAKLGSDYKKPDATTVISLEHWKEIVFPLPVGDLLFVGHSAQVTLNQFGIKTIGDLAQFPLASLEQVMGKMGAQLHCYANGEDESPVLSYDTYVPPKSIGNGSTFRRGVTTLQEAKSQIDSLSDEVAMRLRKEGMYCQGVSLTIKSETFETISRQTQLKQPTFLMREISSQCVQLLQNTWHFPKPIRMLTVTAIHLVPAEDSFEQSSLFDVENNTKHKKLEQLELAMDSIRQKYGTDSISYGKSSTEL